MTSLTMPQVEFDTMAGLFMTRAEDDNTGLMFEDERWSWREVLRAAAVRSAIQQEWKPADDRPWHVGVLLENTPEYLFQIAGAAFSGATIVGINPTRRGAELALDIRATHVDTIVVDAAYAELLEGLDHGATRVVRVDSPEYADLLARHADAPLEPTAKAQDPSNTLVLLFTSGSTGAPKAVICSTRRWAFVSQVNPMMFGYGEVAYNAMPLFHGNALMSAWGPCIKGGAALAMRRKFSASGFLADIQKFGATFFNYVGRSLAYVLAQPEVEGESDNQLKFGFGTEASARDRAEFLRRFGAPVYESYGQSEGACYIIHNDTTPDGSLGVPQIGHHPVIWDADGNECAVAVFDDNGLLVNAEEAIGEIVSLDAASKFEGYYNNPEASAEKLRDGHFFTGDLAYRDAEGFFYFAGRTADWIRVDSENFAAAPVERIVARFPGVAVAAVYPVPDPQTGDQVMATVQMVVDADFDPDAFAAFLSEQPDLGTKWAPRLIRVTASLPVTATSKVDKPKLRRMLWGGDEPVFERLRDGSYVQLDDEGRARIEGLFAEHGRTQFIR